MPKNARCPMVIVVACVLESAEGTVLLARRPEGRPLAGLWEFPGGKVEPEEKVEDLLIRELGEELGVVIDSDDLAPLTFVSHAYGDFNLLMPLYLCRKWTGEVMAREGQDLKLGEAQRASSIPNAAGGRTAKGEPLGSVATMRSIEAKR